jgi:hypothetical protein
MGKCRNGSERNRVGRHRLHASDSEQTQVGGLLNMVIQVIKSVGNFRTS